MANNDDHCEARAPESEVDDDHNSTVVEPAVPVLNSDSKHQTVPLATANPNPADSALPQVQAGDPYSYVDHIDLSLISLPMLPNTTSDLQTDINPRSSYYHFSDLPSWQNTTAEPQTDDSSSPQPEAEKNTLPTPTRNASAHNTAAGGLSISSNIASDLYSNLLTASGPQQHFASAAPSDTAPPRRLAHPLQRVRRTWRTSIQPIPTFPQSEPVARPQRQSQGRQNRAQTSSSYQNTGPAFRQPDSHTMARGPGTVYENVIDATFTALTTISQRTARQTYQLVVHNLVQVVTNDHRIPNTYVNRTNFDVALARAIIRATNHPEQYTRAFLDHLQNVGLFIFDDVTANRAVWFDELEVVGLRLPVQFDRDRYLEQIGNRDWRGSWVQGTLIGNRPENENGSEDGTVDNTSEQEVGLRPVDENDSDLPPLSNGAPRLSNSPPAPNSRRSAKRPPAKSASKKRAPDPRLRRGINARAAARDDPNNTLTERVINGTTTWATNMGGRLVEFASHVRGQQRPWKCLLGDTFTTSERGSLTKHLQHRHQMDPADLAHMQVDNSRPSNFEGHDNKDCYIYGQYVEGDPLPWKCLLCSHKGCKSKDTFPRHMNQNHGIRVIPPPITSREMDRHHKKRVKSGAWARQLAALENLEERRNAAAAQEAANQAGLALTLVGSSVGVKRSASEADLDDDGEVEEEDGWEEQDTIEMEKWLARATGANLEDGEE